jgi:DNA polymerase III subunit alpha
MTSSFFHTHVHSEFSCLDGMASIADMAEKVKRFNQPALALTDHGNMSGTFQLYKECKKRDILPFAGLEAYVVEARVDKKAKRHHITLVAYTTEGYKNLVNLSNVSHNRDHYYYKPLLDLDDLATLHAQGMLKGISAGTGCYFGMVSQLIVANNTAKAERLVGLMAGWFDPLFIEVQNHHSEHGFGWNDAKLAEELYGIAQRKGLQVIVTQDCHYCDKGEKPLHEMMKTIAYSADANDVAWPGDSYHLASTPWMKQHYKNDLAKIWDSAEDSYKWLLDNHSLVIEPLEKYQYFVPVVAKQNPNTMLKSLCDMSMKRKKLVKQSEYAERLEYELDIVTQLGMADYFLLVNDYVSWCLDNEILVMARGSAAGSLICYLLGITQVDPIHWNLSFDRFLSTDRIRPPDIDLDIEDIRRSDVVDYLKKRYDITQIGTYNRLGMDEDTGRGGLFVQYISAQRKILGDKFPAKLGKVQTLHDLDRVSPKDAELLRQLSAVPLRRSAGAHAAGFVVSAPPAHALDEWIPKMLIPSSDTMVTQMMMDDVEDAGFIKIDLLGLRSLTTLKRCLEMISKSGVDWIPLDDEKTFRFLRRGHTETGVFQMEGWTAARGCKEIEVKTVNDLILVNALYRPATINSGYTKMFLRNRKTPSRVRYPHQLFEKHLGETFGVPAFQEQVLALLKDLGMPAYELNSFLKAVKGKHAVAGYSEEATKIFDDNKQRFADLCKVVGMTAKQIEKGWELVEGFASYGFNRAHATAYSLFGYQMAYLKMNYPLEFHTALLETTGGNKEQAYVKETRRMGVSVLPADVNVSGALWTIDRKENAIRRGLSSIKGIGNVAAECLADNAPYISIDDIVTKCPARMVTGGKQWADARILTGVLEKLRQAGALKSLGIN